MRVARGFLALMAAAVVVVGSPAVAGVRAQVPTPTVTPAAAPRIVGDVSGSLRRGATIAFRCDVTMPGGWQALHLVEVATVVGERELERITYVVESSRVRIAGRSAIAGTGAEATGSYLRIRGPGVVVTTGGAYLSVIIRAEVVQSVPEDARFVLSATSDAGVSASATRGLTEPGSTGIGWDTVVAVVLFALLVGTFLGNLLASRRRPAPQLSVYGAIQRQLDADRSAGRDR